MTPVYLLLLVALLGCMLLVDRRWRLVFWRDPRRAAIVLVAAVALLLTSQFVAASHSVGAQVAAIALPVILVTELLGAVLATLAFRRSGEAVPPARGARIPSFGEDTRP